MKKIIMPFDEQHSAPGAFQFVCRINEIQPVLLTGVFLSPVHYMTSWGHSSELYINTLEDDNENIKKNVKQFATLCKKNHIEYRVHTEDAPEIAITQLKKESRFADLMIISSTYLYEQPGGEQPNDYNREILAEAECPVLIVPDNAAFPATNILAYDGSESSVYAIKSFAYLFPELCNNPTLLVYANESDRKELPDQPFIEELAARHFPDLTLYKLSIDPKKFFASWISEEQSAMLVSGSFGRSSLSQRLKKSFVLDLVKDHSLPVFITHK